MTSASSVPSFSDLRVPDELVSILTARGHHHPDPDPGRDAARLARRPRRPRPRPHRLRQDLRLPAAARGAPDPVGQAAQAGKPRALILAPTRELVGQIQEALIPLADAFGLTTQTVFGGVGQNPQVDGLRRGVDIVLACPGRLEDLIQQGHCSLGDVEITILDEADHMADLGFLPAVRRLLEATPRSGQRLLFSATLDNAIDVLVKKFLTSPPSTRPTRRSRRSRKMDHHVLHLAREHRVPVLVDLTSAPGRTVVFTRTKHGAKALARQLNKSGVPTVDLHGNLSQNARTRNMEAFHSGKATTLVATDIAARGIHVDDVALVVHADPPTEHKAYLHRSGRTARAGAAGTVITLMTDEQVRDVRAADPRRRHQAHAHQDRRCQAPDPGPARPRRARPGARRPRAHGLRPGASSTPRPAAARGNGRNRSGGGNGGGARSGADVVPAAARPSRAARPRAPRPAAPSRPVPVPQAGRQRRRRSPSYRRRRPRPRAAATRPPPSPGAADPTLLREPRTTPSSSRHEGPACWLPDPGSRPWAGAAGCAGSHPARPSRRRSRTPSRGRRPTSGLRRSMTSWKRSESVGAVARGELVDDDLVQLLGHLPAVVEEDRPGGLGDLAREAELEQAYADAELGAGDQESVGAHPDDAERDQGGDVLLRQRAAGAALQLGALHVDREVGLPGREHGARQGDVLGLGVGGQRET